MRKTKEQLRKAWQEMNDWRYSFEGIADCFDLMPMAMGDQATRVRGWCIEVLASLPREAFDALSDPFPLVFYASPGVASTGMVSTREWLESAAPRGRKILPYIILPSDLADEHPDAAKATIAHEFAHVYLAHCDQGDLVTLDESDKIEPAADDLARVWGFDMGAGDGNRDVARVAYHEAGHVVAAFLTGAAIESVDIISDGDNLGTMRSRPLPRWFQPDIDVDSKTRHLIEREVIVCFAGQEAERRYSGRVVPGRASQHYQQDYQTAVNVADYAAGGDETGPFCEWLRVRAKGLVTRVHWPLVEAVASELVKHRQLTARQIREVIRAAMRE